MNRFETLARRAKPTQQNLKLDYKVLLRRIRRPLKRCNAGPFAPTKKARRGALSLNVTAIRRQAMAFTRAAKRDIFRDAVFLWYTPFVTPRISSGCADFSAVWAASLSPEAIASSTLRRYVRMRDRRALFT